MQKIRLATRESALALWQTEHVAARLREAHPDLEVELVPMTTRGDQAIDQPLVEIGGKGLFLKELEVAMLEGRADAAVHSLKDVPMELDGPFELAAILERADPFDAFVSVKYEALEELPFGAKVGTSSLRRQALLRAHRPDLVLVDLRGNVNTRLAKLDAGDYDAIVLACAGLQRLGLGERIRERLTAPRFIPAAAQGAVTVECKQGDAEVHALLAVLDHGPTRACVRAERAMTRTLGGSCHVPIAAYATLNKEKISLEGLVGDAKTGQTVRGYASGPVSEPDKLGEQVADMLVARGADALLP
ncbi:hydroxymethylbilane synthase [Arenimonas terrae]|jgi:hydroxymethylbilane synthase|uniref:Porphobilinogen deaminase n=1 Tax=Arenimonas terrae TaxID=2546226 RepID=A0A5C4RPJ9_9GAMM|nr:hydroxymethylbilane synthase [Arenimonas terrae]TNJ33018.1 hydroxymethylbilane synthase [Arenimonas terrae]